MAKVSSNLRQVNRDINRVKRSYRRAMQGSLAEMTNEIRMDAHDHFIIPNRTGIDNPYRARKAQPSKSGILTSRTGKLKYMLRNKVSKKNPTKGWKGFGNRLVKHKSAGLHGLIRQIGVGSIEERYRATLRVQISDDHKLYFTGWGKRGGKDKMPRESKRTLALRFMWDWGTKGVRGQRRPFITPAANSNKKEFRGFVRERWNRLVKLENRKARMY